MINQSSLAGDLNEILAATEGRWEELRGRRVFITGATGFFGCWLLESFVWANQRLDLRAHATILTRNPDKVREKLPHLDFSAIQVVAGDIRDFRFPDGEFSHVIHAATESSAVLNASQPQLMFETIVQGTRHCLEFAGQAGCTKFLFTSSGAAYGKQPVGLTHVPEDFSGSPDPLDPNSAYAEGKRAAELLCAIAAKSSGLQVKIARCFAFAGPYMKLDAHFAIGNFIRDCVEGNRIVVHGDGTPMRSYLYASDLMIWLWTILFRGETCRPYNVGSEDGISIADLAHEVANLGGKGTPVQILGKPVPGAAATRYVPRTARAQQELGLRCCVPLRETIRRTIEWNLAEHGVPTTEVEVAR